MSENNNDCSKRMSNNNNWSKKMRENNNNCSKRMSENNNNWSKILTENNNNCSERMSENNNNWSKIMRENNNNCSKRMSENNNNWSKKMIENNNNWSKMMSENNNNCSKRMSENNNSCSKKKKDLDIFKLAAALSPKEKACLVNAFKHLAGEPLNVLGSLVPIVGRCVEALGITQVQSLTPNVRKRVEALQVIQKEHGTLEAKFFEELAALEAKYQKLYEPLYLKRYDIVNGVVKVDGVTSETTPEDEDEKGPEAKGVPNFWLIAIKNSEVAEEITKQDEEALKYLKDIKWARINDRKGFKLEFFFASNPFFKNTVLTKIYHMIYEVEPLIDKAIGTEIEWLPGKCLTQKILKEKPKKGSKNVKPITKTESCESFFKFFNPPQIPKNAGDLDEDAAEELRSLFQQDYEIGCTIRDKIIPHAVSWFTGEAVEEDDSDDSDGGFDGLRYRDDDDDKEEDDGDSDGEVGSSTTCTMDCV